jgi:hypothetical protein
LVISDAHTGLKQPINAGNVQAQIPKASSEMVAASYAWPARS